MGAITRYLWIMVLLVGLAGVAFGIVFMVNGFHVKALIAEELRREQVTLELPKEGEEGYIEGNVIDTPAEVEAASDHLQESRLKYGTYGELPRGSDERARFLDALTMESSLNLARLGYGVSTMAIGSGVTMVVIGVGLVGTGLVLYRRR